MGDFLRPSPMGWGEALFAPYNPYKKWYQTIPLYTHSIPLTFFGKNSRLRFLFRQFLKRSNIDAFLSPSTLKTEIFSRKKNEGMLCVYREIFDTIFNMSYWSGKSPMDKRVKKKTQIQI